MRRFAVRWWWFGVCLAGTAGAVPGGLLLDLVRAARAAPPSCPGAPASPAVRPPVRKTLLDLAAREQARFIADSGLVTHDGPDGRRPKDRAAARGVRFADLTEIVYLGQMGGPDRAVAWWVGEPLHCRLLTDPRWTLAGTATVRGRAGTAYVVVFARR